MTTLPFIAAVLFVTPSLVFGFHWGQFNWLMQPLTVLSLLLLPLVWILFVVMGVSWAMSKRVHRSIPIMGMVIGPLCLLPWIPLVVPIIVMLPAILFAVRVVAFHLDSSEISSA